MSSSCRGSEYPKVERLALVCSTRGEKGIRLRISMLGNSDTTGILLRPDEKSWPTLVQERLALSLNEPVAVDSRRFVPYRRGAVEHALGIVDEVMPDVVVLTLASFWCAFGTVQARVEQSFGPRAARLYKRAEGAYISRVETVGRAVQPDRGIGRKAARRLIGTATYMDLKQFVQVYGDLVRALSQRERMHVVVLSDHHYNDRIRREMPGIVRVIAEIQAAIKPVVDERKLLWGDLEVALVGEGSRENLIQADGVHMTAEAHQRVAAMLVPLLAAIAAPR